MNKSPTQHALTIVFIYAVLSAIWILSSDWLIEIVTSSPRQLALANTLKSWLFLLMSSLLLYWLIQRLLGIKEAPQESLLHGIGPIWLPALLIALFVIPLTITLVYSTIQEKKTSEISHLQAISDLKSEYVDNWLEERHQDLRFIQFNSAIPTAFQNWRQNSDQNAFHLLSEQLQEIAHIGEFEGVTLLDRNGISLWKSTNHHSQIDAATIEAVLRLANSGEVEHFGPYKDSQGETHLDFIIPFRKEKQAVDFVLLLHMDPTDQIFSTISEWPVPSKSGEVVLFRRDGLEIEFLNNLRHAPNSAMQLRWPLDDEALLAAQLARGDWAMAHAVEGKDYRNESVFGVGRRIPGTDWFLLAKMDWSEIYDEALQDATWMGFSGLFTLLMGIIGLYLLRQRQQLAVASATHQAQAERIQALNLLSVIADSSTDAIYAKDLQGRYLLFNRQAEIFTGKSKDEALMQDDRFLFPAHQAEMVMNNDRMLIDQNRVITLHEEVDTQLGPVTFLATKGPLKDESGEVTGTFGVSRDITEMHMMEQELREKESRLRTLFQTLPDLIWLKDPEGKYLACNQNFERFFGAKEDDILGKTDYDFLSEEQAEFFRAKDQAAIDAGESVSNKEWITFADDGHRALLLTTKCPIIDESGGLIGVLGIGRDITSLHQTEEALRESLEHFRLFYENAPVAYESLDQNGNILDVNPSWLELLGFDASDREQIIGRSITDFIIAEQHPLLEKRFTEFLSTGKVVGKEYDLRRRDGKIITVSVDGRTGHDPTGKFNQTHCVLHDITERKQHDRYMEVQARRASILLGLPQIAEDLDETSFMQHALSLTQKLIDSPIALIYSVNQDQETIKLVAWSKQTQQEYCQSIHDKSYPIEDAGIWADAFRLGKPVVFNAYQEVTEKHRPPDCQLTLSRIISLPVMEKDQVVMLVVVGDKERDYTDLDVETTQLIANEIWHIIQRRRGVNALTSSESRYRELVDNMSDGVAVYEAVDDGADFIFREYNKSGERIGKNKRADTIGRRVTEVFPGIESLGLLQIFKRVWQTGEAESFPINQYQDNRLQIWVENYVYRLPGGEVVAIFNDITDHKLAEDALKKSEERYRGVVEDTPVLICSFLPHGEITFVNKAYCDYFQKSFEALLDSNFLDLIPNRDRATVKSLIEALTPDSPTQSHEHQVISKSGKTRWLRWTNRALFTPQGEIISYQSIGQDITERKLAEIKVSRLNNELEIRVNERTEELESANKELESFVYSVSHDLRAPLRAVTGFAHILVNRHLDSLNEEGQHYLKNVLEAGNHMGILIDDLLQYSRTGRGTLQMRPIELAPIIEGLEVTFAELMENSNAQLIIEKPLATPLGDATLIGQQFSNLIENALTYYHPDTAPVIRITSKRQGNQVFVRVIDNGIGIAPEYHQKIFKVFQRLHGQDDYPGTGVGLAIVAKAARMMEGEVKVESTLGKGSQFTLILPAAEIH
ncbi:MAG: PAS domain S-box protein [Candidatus Thiodiazotropha sp.]